MAETEIAAYVRDVDHDESLELVVLDAKALTFDTFCEHALLRLRGGRRVLVRGGPYGIELERSVPDDPFGREPNCLFLTINGELFVVEALEFHVHPTPTGGPSDGDLLVLKLLGQRESILYELFGPAEGTLVRPKNSGERDVE